nr:PREDICTED: ADAMTS-like protein 4 [Notothenia coriiceps]
MSSIRAEKKFPPCETDNPEDQVKPMLDWANGGFLPKGGEGLKPTHSADSNPLDNQVLDVSLPEYFPSAKRPRVSLCKGKAAPEETYSREQMVNEVLKNNRSIEEFCLSCGKTRVATFHPLFNGGLCQNCKPEFNPNNQDHVSVYRSPYHAPSQGYNQPARTIRRPTNPGAARAVGSRRSASANREGLTSRRSSAIRPGQFGYGRVPFSLPLHRQNRQARHTVNGTDAETAGLNEDDAENNKKEEEETGSDGEDRQAARRQEALAAAEELPTKTTTIGQPHRNVNRPPQTNTEHRRARVPPPQPFSRSSSPSLLPNRHRFDWHSLHSQRQGVPHRLRTHR